MELLVLDTHPFFLRVLEHGRYTGAFHDSFFVTLEEVGAQVSVRVASQYLNVMWEEDILMGVRVMLGVVSLGLLEESQGEIEHAVRLLQREGLARIFRLGWTCIHKLARSEVQVEVVLRKVLPERQSIEQDLREKELLFRVAVEHTSLEWDGHRLYKERNANLREEGRIAEFGTWLEKHYYHILDEVELAVRPGTLLASLLVSNKPVAPMSIREVRAFLKILARNPEESESKIRLRASQLRDVVPEKWIDLWESVENQFFDCTLPHFRSYLAHGEASSAYEYAFEYALYVTP